MTLPLHPEILAGAYDYLKTTPPFNRWNLPESEDVLFIVTRSKKVMGTHSTQNGRHVIEVSRFKVGYTGTLMALMAHEIIHLHQNAVGMETKGVEHNAAFDKLAKHVCKYHGFDPHEF